MDDGEPDVIDQAILYHLQQDGRRSITAIADALDVSDNTVRNRIRDMEAKDLITGYQVNVDYDKTGDQHHFMFICTVRVSDREQLADEVRDLPGVVEVITLMTGTNNVLIVAARSDKDEISDLAVSIDDLGLTIEREHLIRKHVRQAYSGFEPPDYLSQR